MNQLTNRALAEYGKCWANGVVAVEETLFSRGDLAKRMGLLELPRKG
jgi:hypothetical protein